jgi:hypothetical protein
MYQRLSTLLAGLCSLVMAVPAHAQMSEQLATQLSQNVDQHVIVIMKSQHPAVHKDSSEATQRSAAIDIEQAAITRRTPPSARYEYQELPFG